jgi:hypothetical protein
MVNMPVKHGAHKRGGARPVEKVEVKEVNRWLLQLAQSFAAGPKLPQLQNELLLCSIDRCTRGEYCMTTWAT